MRNLSILLALVITFSTACLADTEHDQGSDQGAAGSVGVTQSALIPGTYSFKNSNSASNMQSATYTNYLRGFVMGQDPRTASNSWSCVATTNPVGAKCTAVWQGVNQTITLSGCVLQPAQAGFLRIEKCPISVNTFLYANATYSVPNNGSWWSAQGKYGFAKTFQILNTCSPNSESCWQERVQ
jgi:hypothetical protein